MATEPPESSESERVLSAYLAGRLSVADAVAYFVALTDEAGAPGTGVDLESVDDDTRERAQELFRRIAWCKFTGGDPTAEPPLAFDEMLKALQRGGSAGDPESSV